MERFRNNWLSGIFTMALLGMMALKLCAFIINRSATNSEPFSIEKNAEEGKDAKEESFGKSEKKLLISGHYTIDHIHYAWISNLKPVCRYKMQVLTDPPKTVPTPPPNFSV